MKGLLFWVAVACGVVILVCVVLLAEPAWADSFFGWVQALPGRVGTTVQFLRSLF